MTSTEPLAPSRLDPVVAAASGVIGGPVGRHAVGRSSRWWTPLRVLLALTVLTSVLGFLEKAPCRTHPWANEYQYTRMCYSDVYALYFAEGLVNGKVPYRDQPVEYPVVIGGVMWAAASIAHVAAPDNRPKRFFDVTALLLAACALVVTWTAARLSGRQRVWDAAMVALAPVLLLHAYTNWDLIAVAFAGLGLYAWSRRAPAWAGIWIGLGIATKLYPLLLLAALFLLCLRERRLRSWLVATGTAALAWLVVDLPVWLAYPGAFGRFFSLNRTRPADWDSLWFLAQHVRGTAFSEHALNLGVGVATAAVVLAVTALTLRAPRRPRVAQVTFLLVAGFLLANKVDSPQYALWLLPLAVLARPRWRPFLIWQATEVWLLFTRFYFFVGNDYAIAHPGGGAQGLPIQIFLWSVVVRDLALAALMALVVRDLLRPAYDVVRRGGVDDPAGGVLVAA